MAEIKQITNFLDEELKTAQVEDTSNNGLQVAGKTEVRKIAFAVDACVEVFEKAIEASADMIIVHHGMSWADSLKYITGINYNRLKLLIKNDVSLYASHLPLDMHDRYGNNIQLAKMLGLNNIEYFGKYHGATIGKMGCFNNELTLEELKQILEDKLNAKCLTFKFGKEKIKTIGIVSGGGSLALNEAVQKDLDCFLTGEAPHQTYQEAKESRMNVIMAGHYETETVGVKALMPLLKEKFGVEVVFIDAQPEY
ncbi:MAG: Nif3-like dinuclear metal center hexameric protein [Nanoarchaeota archaeon]|nr:Nif3-like dinuclear metal center hexameric protein [Nanoarchaeota archaeon]